VRRAVCRLAELPAASAVHGQRIVADEEMNMDKDRIKGAAKNTTGKMKEAAGKMTGDTKMQAEGKMDRAAGKARNAMGGAKDAMKK
jgi:uncharacterized protein YjbJ (UPF0337 family)